ncbi:MAG: translocation/assembly module TamB domain-containing protein [Pseudomonadota bacterium]
MDRKNSTVVPPRIPNVSNRLAKWALGGVFAFFLVPAIIAALFLFPSVRTELKNQLLGQLETYLNAKVGIGAITGDLLKGLTLEALRVTTDDGDILRLESLSLGYSIPLILKKNIHIREVHVRGLQVTYVSHPDGTSNFSNLLKPVVDETDSPSSTPSPVQLVIGKLVLEDSVFRYRESPGSPGAGQTIGQEIRIEKLAARFSYGEELTLQIADAAVGMNNPNFPHLAVQGTVGFNPNTLRLDLHDVDIRTGDSFLRLAGTFLFDGETPSFDLHLACEPVRLSDLKTGFSIGANADGEVRGQIGAKGNFSKFFHQIALSYAETSLNTEGVVTIGDSGRIGLDISGAGRHVNPAAIPFATLTAEAGDVNADFRINGRFSPDFSQKEGVVEIRMLPSKSPWIEITKGNILADLSENRFTLSGVEIGTAMGAIQAAGEVQLKQSGLSLRDATLSASFGRLQLEGSLSNALLPDAEKHLDLKTKGTGVNPAAFFPGKRAQGILNFDIRLEAELPPDMVFQQSRVTLTATAASSQIGGMSLTSGQLLAGWENERLRIDSFELDTDFGKVKADGDISPFRRTGHLRAIADIQDAGQVYKRLCGYFPDLPADLALTGALQVEADVTGSADAAGISLTCKGRDVGAKGILTKSFQLSGKRTGPLTQLAGETRVELDLYHESENCLTVKGKIDSLKDGAQNITIDTLSFASPKIAILDSLENKGPIHVRWAGDALVINALRMQSEAAALSLTGEVSASGRENLQLRLSDLELSRLSWLWEKQRNMSGVVSASALVRGTPAAPVIDAKITATRLTGYQMTGADLEADLAYADSKADLSVLLTKNGDKRLSTRGTIGCRLQFNPFQPDFSKVHLDFSIQTSGLRLSDLPIPTFKEIAFDAAVAVDMRVSGEAGTPDIKGNIKLTDGYLILPKNGLTYETLTGNIFFSGETIEVRDLFLKGDKEGYLRGNGTVGLKGIMPDNFDIRLAGEDFFIPYQKAITARVTPRLKLTGSLAAPVLTGDLSIIESKINLDRMAGPSVPEIQIIERPTDPKDARLIIIEEKQPAFMNALAAAVTIRAPKNVWLKGQDINAEIAGEMGLNKEAGKPFSLLGGLSSLRGTYYFRGKPFRIEKGTVEFIGLEDPNPNIDIEAVTKIQEADIIIHITGTARKLVLTLDSDPRMEQSDIISYMVFGKPTDSLKGGQAFNAEKAAMRFSGGLLAAELRNILGDVFFLDAFAVEPGENGEGAVSVGKYVRPNMYVTYRYGLAEEEPSQVEISYEFNPNIRVETQLGNDKNSGVDLFWQLDF